MKLIRHRKITINQECLSFYIKGVGDIRISTYGGTRIHITGSFNGTQTGCEMNAELFIRIMGEVVSIQNKNNPESEI